MTFQIIEHRIDMAGDKSGHVAAAFAEMALRQSRTTPPQSSKPRQADRSLFTVWKAGQRFGALPLWLFPHAPAPPLAMRKTLSGHVPSKTLAMSLLEHLSAATSHYSHESAVHSDFIS